jgi:two-component system, NarL family, nitrate/nitrite response regulator NarL
MSNSIKVIIADDHDHIIASLENLLSAEPHIDILSAASNGKELLRLASAHKTCIVVTDTEMPVMNGIEATVQLAKTNPGIKVIILSGCHEPAVINRAIDAGAKGFVLKTSPRDEIIWAIKTVHETGEYFCPGTLQTLKNSDNIQFSRREYEVLQNLYDGLSAKKAADKMKLSPRTIEHCKERIMEKINVNNMVDLVKYVIINKILLLTIFFDLFADGDSEISTAFFNCTDWIFTC